MLAFYRGKSWLSWLIRWRTWRDASHVAWICKDGTVIEAWAPGGVRHVSSLSCRHTPGTRIRLYAVAGLHSETVEKLLTGELGAGYDYWGILGFALRRKTENKRRWFCSELIYWAIQQAGIQLLRESEPSKVSPGDLEMSPMLTLYGDLVTT